MKYLKTYNESLRDKMKPKSDEEILKELGNLSPDEMLLQSINYEYINGVKLAIEKGANINYQGDGEYYTPLMRAIRKVNKEIAELLLKNGADINKKNRYGFTNLMVASRIGHKDIVELLIKAGANLNIKNKNGWTALRYASEKGHKEIVEILKKYGAK